MRRGLIGTRAGSERPGWARSQGGNSAWGGVLQIEALQEVLKKLKSKRIPVYEKKYGQVPMVRLWGPPSPGFSERKDSTLSLNHGCPPRMWLHNSTNGLAEFCGLLLFPTAALPLVSKGKGQPGHFRG